MEEPILKWKKTGLGSLRLAGRTKSIVKPGQTFEAKRSEIPKAFMDTIICLSEDKELEFAAKSVKADVAGAKSPLYKIEPIEEKPDFYNVVNKEGKSINDKPLRKKKAEELIASLS